MKKAVLLVFLLVYGTASAQTEADSMTNNILTTKIYRPGIYKTLQEFKTNSPSFNDTAFVLYTRTDKEIYWQEDNRYKLYIRDEKGNLSETYDEPYWGYSDGKFLYIKSWGDPKMTNLEKIETVGIYSFYYSHKSNNAIVPAAGFAFGLVGAVTAAIVSEEKTVRPLPYIFNFNTGATAQLTAKLERQIIEQDKSLTLKLRPGQRLTQPVLFLQNFNQRNQHLIKPF